MTQKNPNSQEKAEDGQSQRPTLETLTDLMLKSYRTDRRTEHTQATFLPNRYKAIELLELLRELCFPGFYTRERLTPQTLTGHVERLLKGVRQSLEEQIEISLRYRQNQESPGTGDGGHCCAEKSRAIADDFLLALPEIRRLLATDVQAAFDGDPAAKGTDEAIFCYPGVDAVFTYRIAHQLFELGVPLLPRMLTEYAHNETGIDIHPGATIGRSFFIDHGTGVVIGETAILGANVKLYQGVTLGALSFPKDDRGQLIRGRKRHPTIEDDVTIYANATILGGSTVVGNGCVIGGGVFLTQSVPPGHLVTMKSSELRYRSAERYHQQLMVPREPGAESEPIV